MESLEVTVAILVIVENDLKNETLAPFLEVRTVAILVIVENDLKNVKNSTISEQYVAILVIVENDLKFHFL